MRRRYVSSRIFPLPRLMKHHYPRTPLLARLGYLLMLVAAVAFSYPIIVDIYSQLTPDDRPASPVESVSLPVVPSSQSGALTGDETGSTDLDENQSSQFLASDNETTEDWTPESRRGLMDGKSHSVVSAVASDIASEQDSVIDLTAARSVVLQPGMLAELQKQDGSSSKSTQAVSKSEPVVQKSPRHDAMVTPGNFSYLGAFRLPHVQGQKSRFAYGGHAITFCPSGDKSGAADGFSGSLFMVGHKQHELVAEVSIPRPFVSANKDMDELPVAKVVQPFADITVGKREQLTGGSSEAFQFGGMQYLDGRLHWTLFKYYNVSGVDYLSHGLSNTDLSSPSMAGMWHLGPRNSQEAVWHSYKHAGYVADIPKKIADGFFGGRSLMSGLQISTGLSYSSQGPALYAYRPPTGKEAPGSSLDATPLLWYSMDNPIDQHHYADLWTGAAWVNVGGKHAAIIVGRKALGPVYYGESRPTDCYPDKGYHGSSYEVQMLFYAPAHLLRASKKKVADVQPFSRWDANTEGGGIDRFMFQKCGRDIGGMAYDRQNNLIYISEMNAALTSDNEWETLPIIHVFRLGE